MRKHSKFAAIAFLMLGMQCSTINASTNNSLNLQMNSSTNMEEYNSIPKTFVVNVAKEGYYYLNAWILPALHEDGNYSKYTVVLNGETVGYISATKGGWQSAALDGNRRLMLKKGDNTISMYASDSEVPCIEDIRIADNSKSAAFESSYYDEYLQLAETGSAEKVMREQMNNEISTYSNNANTLLVDRNVPIKYSFFKVFYFLKGQSVTVSAKSIRYPHSVDMIYIGIPTTLPINDNVSDSKYSYTEATSDEVQGLNWKRNSTINKNADYNSSSTH